MKLPIWIVASASAGGDRVTVPVRAGRVTGALPRVAIAAVAMAAVALPGGVAASSPTGTDRVRSAGESAPAASPTYIVKTYRLYCGDESGWDWTGSDEPYLVITTKWGTKAYQTDTMRTITFGDVDSGDWRDPFTRTGNTNIIWPQQASTWSAYGPIALTIQLYESDWGNASKVMAYTEKAFDAIAAGAEYIPMLSWVNKVPPVVRNSLFRYVERVLGDDMMGSQTIYLSNEYLESRLTSPKTRIRLKYHFSGGGSDLPFGLGGSPDYDLYLDVIRLT